MSETTNIFNIPNCLVTRHCDEGDVLPEYRTEFMRDRDRLMYATAFRRLSGKTQIYTVGRDDHKKNRLTHTLEVSQIARTIAIALHLNPDLAEAIALGHDFGHTPFGHAGEKMLHDIMVPNSSYVKQSPFYHKDISEITSRFEREDKSRKEITDYAFGFKHNLQSVRVSALLEDSYRNASRENIGLNLTNFTLYGMMIHSALKYEENDLYPNFQQLFRDQMKLKDSDEPAWSFEAYIVKIADDIAQWHHDLEDAMREGVLPLTKICDTVLDSLRIALTDEDQQKLFEIRGFSRMDRHCIAELSHIVVNTLVNDLVNTSTENFNSLKVELDKREVVNSDMLFKNYNALGLEMQRETIVAFSSAIKTDIFKGIIKESIHHSRNVERMNEKGKYIIRKLFEAYYAHPQQLPDGPILHLLVDLGSEGFENIDCAKSRGIGEARVEFEKIMKNPTISVECMLMRRICDHIASMTDHYAIEEYNSLYG